MDNMKIDLREIGWVVWTGSMCLQWRALVNTVMNLRVPYNAGKFLSTTGGFSRRAQLRK
jgi:hypothetical protein